MALYISRRVTVDPCLNKQSAITMLKETTTNKTLVAPKFQTVSRVQIKVLKFKALEVFKHLGYTNCGGKSLRWGIVALLMGRGKPEGGGSEAKLIL